ncbi:MAG: limonene-1,2-epoxide hydrolase family protein [Microthrixaceae bacterium]|nr:nuclear transport factor 2 family protein [Microthrixaceae bacterium]MCB1012854.1 nuclear transport factor 2 family protein [Microthrixaceae bacterium]
MPNEPAQSPAAVTRAFLAALRAEDVDLVMTLMDDEVVYANKGLPRLKGRRAAERVFRQLEHSAIGFDTYIHSISTDGCTVHTERTDIHRFGPLFIQFWICGRYDVREGKLILIREYFDFVDILRATVRGAITIALPRLAVSPPGPDTAPGR